MEIRIQLKVCEGCGCLWYRQEASRVVYCGECEVKLREFPTPESRKRRGRPARHTIRQLWAVTEVVGGAQ